MDNFTNLLRNNVVVRSRLCLFFCSCLLLICFVPWLPFLNVEFSSFFALCLDLMSLEQWFLTVICVRCVQTVARQFGPKQFNKSLHRNGAVAKLVLLLQIVSVHLCLQRLFESRVFFLVFSQFQAAATANNKETEFEHCLRYKDWIFCVAICWKLRSFWVHSSIFDIRSCKCSFSVFLPRLISTYACTDLQA